ncbi:MAG: hypothetical protein NTV80_04955, partial [Verrucomicrobia bacterium]|nr:hypothetical protein [Verrucomicrobiota bacterium]
MRRGSASLVHFRTPSFWRDCLVAVQMALTLLMPCYAGIPDWWTQPQRTAFHSAQPALRQQISTARGLDTAESESEFSLRCLNLLRCKGLALSGTLQTSTSYDAWGTAKVTTSADGLKSVRLTQFFK